jgi:hypothetical protein
MAAELVDRLKWAATIVPLLVLTLGHDDKSRGRSWMNYSLRVPGLIHPSCPTCKLKLANMRFRAEILNNCPLLTWEIDIPWFLASDRLLGFDLNWKSILVTVRRSQGRLPFLRVLSTITEISCTALGTFAILLGRNQHLIPNYDAFCHIEFCFCNGHGHGQKVHYHDHYLNFS